MNLRDLFGRKPKPPPEDEAEGWIPPTAAMARRRLMMLWANSGRAFLEEEYGEDPVEADTPVAELRTWVHTSLREAATSKELTRHSMPLGSWPERFVVDDNWDFEAAVVLQWALGLDEHLPPWDTEGERHGATQEFFDFPDPSSWHPILTLRDPAEVEHMAQSYEARYWRIRSMDREPDHQYGRKLMGRAKLLGQVDLAPDGDLALSDGTSIVNADEDRLSVVTSIVIERLHALNWLAGQDPDWDMIACNTMVEWLWDECWEGEGIGKPKE